MKVSITHSINLEDIPEKVADLLAPAEHKLSNSIRWLSTLCRDYSNEDISAAEASMSLDRIRKALGECDLVLNEVSNIVQGVVDYEQSLLPPSPEPSPAQKPLSEEEQALADDMLRGLKERQDESNLPF